MPARRLAVLKTFFGFAPKNGPKILRIDLDLTGADAIQDAAGLYTVDFDATSDQLSAVFATAQAIYLDNRQNGAPVLITPSGPDMPIAVPSNSQGMFPFATSGKLRFSAKCAQQVQLYAWLFNTPQPYYVATII